MAYNQLDLNIPTAVRIDVKIGPLYPEDPPLAIVMDDIIETALPASWARKLDPRNIPEQFAKLFEGIRSVGSAASFAQMPELSTAIPAGVMLSRFR